MPHALSPPVVASVPCLPVRTYLELRAACVWTQSRRRMVVCRRSFVRQQQAALSLQCWARAVAARVRPSSSMLGSETGLLGCGDMICSRVCMSWLCMGA